MQEAATAPAKAHPVDLVPDSAYRVGIGNCTGTKAWLQNGNHYPAEGLCGACSGVVRCEALGEEWKHTGRLAGEAPPDPEAVLDAAAATVGEMPGAEIDRKLAQVQDRRSARKAPAGEAVGPGTSPAGQEQ